MNPLLVTSPVFDMITHTHTQYTKNIHGNLTHTYTHTQYTKYITHTQYPKTHTEISHTHNTQKQTTNTEISQKK